MPTIIESIKKELREHADPVKAEFFPRFFRSGKGEYGEGDKFIGVTVPNQRKVVKKYYKDISVDDAFDLLQSKYHEERLTSLFILVLKYQKGSPLEKKEIFEKYLQNAKQVNNWDLVDSSAHKIVGAYLVENSLGYDILLKLSKSKNLWEKRISIISTFAFLKVHQLDPTYKISSTLLKDDHDLIHKAVGWLLREAGKQNNQLLLNYLKDNYNKIHRTTLRYALEKQEKVTKKFYMDPDNF